jgi:hypothetical protein
MDIATILSMTGTGITFKNGIFYDSSGNVASTQELSNLSAAINALQSQGVYGTSTTTETSLTSVLTSISAQIISDQVGSSSSSNSNSNNSNSGNTSGSTPQGPGTVQNVISYSGTALGTLQLAKQFIWDHPASFGPAWQKFANFLDSPWIQGPMAALAAYGFEQGLSALFNGQFSVMGLLSTALSGYAAFTGTVSLVSSLLPTLGPIMGIPGAQFIAAAVLVAMAIIAAIKAWIAKHGKKKDQSLGGGDVGPMPTPPPTPTSWLNGLPSGSVIFLASGVALMGMGINLSATAPTYQFINVPTVALPQLQTSLEAASGQTLPPNPTGDVFVLKGDGTPGDPDRAVIVSPGQGGGDSVQVVTLDPNGNIVGPLPPNTYIPFYQQSSDSKTGVTPISAATTALYDQSAGLRIAQSTALGVGSRFAAMKYAGMSDKIVSPADSGPVDAIPVSATGH